MKLLSNSETLFTIQKKKTGETVRSNLLGSTSHSNDPSSGSLDALSVAEVLVL
jgi:hypothetical protein